MRVSVIIPCYNVASLLPLALASVLRQDHADLEVVCVDDGSTDGTAEVVDDLARRNPGTVVAVHTPNLGASAARNTGIRGSTGEWLQFLDADDVLTPGKISGQLALLAGSEGDLIVADYERVDTRGLLTTERAEAENPWMGLIRTRLGTTSANLWRREAVLRAGGWNDELASSQDYELLFRMLRQGAVVISDPVVRACVLKRDVGSISRTDVRGNWDRYISLRRDILAHLRTTDHARWAAEIEMCRQYIFMALRIVAKEDPTTAMSEYRRSVGAHFTPMVGPATSESYVMLHNLFGFGNAEKLLRVIHRIRA